MDKNTMHIKLKFEALIENWFNPHADIEFNLSFSKECNDREIKLNLTSTDFTSNVDYDDWSDVVSLGALKLVDKLIDWYAKECATPPIIEESFKLTLPEDYDCSSLEIELDSYGALTICCGESQ